MRKFGNAYIAEYSELAKTICYCTLLITTY